MKKTLTNKTNTKRKRTHGFLVRMASKSGRQVLSRRRAKGRKRLAVWLRHLMQQTVAVSMKEHSYRKRERITKRSRFRAIYQQGVWSSSKHFTSITCSNTQGVKRLGITVTKKAGNAVKRNRIKRLIREFFRQNKSLFSTEHDVVIMARVKTPRLTYQDAGRELMELLTRKAHK